MKAHLLNQSMDFNETLHEHKTMCRCAHRNIPTVKNITKKAKFLKFAYTHEIKNIESWNFNYMKNSNHPFNLFNNFSK